MIKCVTETVLTPAQERAGLLSPGTSWHRQLLRISVFAFVWAFLYSAYRAYYAAGGTAFLPGTIRPDAEHTFRAVNLFGAVIIAIAALLPLAMLRLWSRPTTRRLLLVLCWAVAVGCCMHALVAITERVLSLAGEVDVQYAAMWATVDHRAADLQDLFGNEPWFLLEGLAFGALGWVGMTPGRARRWWAATGIVAIGALLALGVLTMTGVLGRAVIF